MRKLLLLMLLITCIGCSQKLSKTIQLVCETHSVDKSVGTITLLLDDEKGTEVTSGGDIPLDCKWNDNLVYCSNQNKYISVDRFSLKLYESHSGITSNGKCKVSEKQI